MITRPVRIFTIGHSDRSIEGLMELLEESSVKMVVDVRSNPASGRFPHFERAQLASSLDAYGIAYRWFRSLGGRRNGAPEDAMHTALTADMAAYATYMNTALFQEAVSELIGVGASTVTAILCAEKDPRRCHRNFLADKLHTMGVRVVHILDAATAHPHELHPDLAVEENRLIYRSKQLQLL